MNLMHIATRDRVIQLALVEKYNVPSMRTYSLPQRNKGSAVLYVNQYDNISIQGTIFCDQSVSFIMSFSGFEASLLTVDTLKSLYCYCMNRVTYS